MDVYRILRFEKWQRTERESCPRKMKESGRRRERGRERERERERTELPN